MASHVRCLSQRFSLLRRSLTSIDRNYATSAKKYIITDLDATLGVAEVKLNKPPVNSLNLELLQEISSTIKELENTKGCRGLILTSTSPTVFCAGLDIMEMYQSKPERMTQFWRSLQQMWMDLYGTRLITIAAINGHAPAGGCLTALSCDYRVMIDGNCTIGMNETLLGIVAPYWFQGTMQNTIGSRQTELALGLGKLYLPDEALKLHMVDELVLTPEELMSKAHSQMKQYLKIPEIARQVTKKNLRQKFIDKMIKYREDDIKTFVTFASAEKTQKALGAYVEALKKRKG